MSLASRFAPAAALFLALPMALGLLVTVGLLLQPPGPGPPSAPSTRPPRRAVAFYNVYMPNEWAMNVTRVQLEAVERFRLLQHLSSIRYVAIVPSGAPFDLANATSGSPAWSGKLVKLEQRTRGDEVATLHHLWEHCRRDREGIVVYYHNKGSHHQQEYNLAFREALDCAVLGSGPRGAGCLELLREGYDLCGMRISPYPYLHVPGNFWWARCGYIAGLIDPARVEEPGIFAQLQGFASESGAGSCSGLFLGLGRFFAEAWVGTGPVLRPADCLGPVEGYAAGYDVPWVNMRRMCPNFKGRPPSRTGIWINGLECGNASLLVDPGAYPALRVKPPKPGAAPQGCSTLNYTRARSKAWYGKDAETVVAWRALYGEV